MIKLRNKKAGMSISIVLFVLAVITLVIYCLYALYIYKNAFNAGLVSTYTFENVYVQEALTDFYIKQIILKMDKKGDNPAKSFGDELQKYRTLTGAYPVTSFIQLEKQLDKPYIWKDDKNIYFSFELIFSNTFYESEDKDAKKMHIIYRRTFSYTAPIVP